MKTKILIVLAEEPVIKENNGTWYHLNKAKEYLRENSVDILILSGGIYKSGQTKPTAQIMHAWFLKQDLKNKFDSSNQRIIEENWSKNTYENIVFSLTAIRAKLKDCEITVISEKYHLRRIRYLFKKFYNLEIKSVPIEYKNIFGRIKEFFLYIYTKLDPSYRGIVAMCHHYFFRKNTTTNPHEN